MACPLCGESCTCSYTDRAHAAGAASASDDSITVLIDPEHVQDTEPQFLASLEAPPDVSGLSDPSAEIPPSDSVWREEVTSRVDAFRARRGRRSPDPSALLSFDFDRAQPDLPAVVSAGAACQAPAAVVEMPPAAPEPKVIEFPRSAEVIAEELAEPVLEAPRILEAPPEELAPPEFGGVSLAPITLEEHSLEIELEPMHLRVAARGLRIFSGLVDTFLVLCAAGLFAAIFVQMTESLPRTRLALVLEIAIPAFFWAAYHYVFLVYGATTPGMRLANLRLSTFEGGHVGVNQRRWRALAMVVSCISVGLGFAWALLDPDGLCWHDKITRTYLTQRSY